jgi:hypothetical protein
MFYFLVQLDQSLFINFSKFNFIEIFRVYADRKVLTYLHFLCVLCLRFANLRVKYWLLRHTQINSTLTDFKINQLLPLIPKGNWLIFQLSPFWAWGKKAEKSQKNIICQNRIKYTLF